MIRFAVLLALVSSLPARSGPAAGYAGKVRDAATKLPLAGVQVAFKSSAENVAGTTDAQGAFSIPFPAGIPGPRPGMPGGFHVRAGGRILSWEGIPGLTEIVLRDLRGRILLRSPAASSGRIPLPALSEGLHFLEARLPGGPLRLRLFSLGAHGASGFPGPDASLPPDPKAKRGSLPRERPAETLVFRKAGYATREVVVAAPRDDLLVDMVASTGLPPKSLVFGAPHGSTMDIRGMSGKETITVDPQALVFDGAGGGGIMFFPVQGEWNVTKDYGEFKGLKAVLKTPVKVVVTVYTGPRNAADGSCTGIEGCGAKRFEVPAGTDGEVGFDFAAGTTLGRFDPAAFRMIALWSGASSSAILTRLEFTGIPGTAACGAPGYSLARLEPPHCKTLVVIGQHPDAQEYLSDALLPAPAGIMTYWEESGAGVAGSFAARPAEETGMLVNVGLSLKQGAGCASDGSRLKAWMGSHWDATPVFLRVGYEIDNEHAQCLAEGKALFARYRAAFADKPNVALVWHTSGYFHDNGVKREITAEYLENVWPGDANVDWIGISYFTNSWKWKAGAMNTLLDFARRRGKPVMLAEASVTDNAGVRSETIWDEYFEQGIRSLALNPDNRIKMICYIATHWPANGWSSPFDTDSRFTGAGPVAAHKAKWVSLIETADPGNVFLNRKDIDLAGGRLRLR